MVARRISFDVISFMPVGHTLPPRLFVRTSMVDFIQRQVPYQAAATACQVLVVQVIGHSTNEHGD